MRTELAFGADPNDMSEDQVALLLGASKRAGISMKQLRGLLTWAETKPHSPWNWTMSLWVAGGRYALSLAGPEVLDVNTSAVLQCGDYETAVDLWAFHAARVAP